jgi:hypothetical protein
LTNWQLPLVVGGGRLGGGGCFGGGDQKTCHFWSRQVDMSVINGMVVIVDA